MVNVIIITHTILNMMIIIETETTSISLYWLQTNATVLHYKHRFSFKTRINLATSAT